MSTTSGLKARVESRKQELIKQLGELKSSTLADAEIARDAIKKRLSELGQAIKEGVVDGWDSLGNGAKSRLSRWLDS